MAKKTKKKPVRQRSAGYRVFMSGFAEYARENGIKIHGGRGSFAKKASEVWKDLKAKPAWKENMDVILPQYLEGVEGAEQFIIKPQDRAQKVIEELGGNQFEWWNLKLLYGLWKESPVIQLDKDNLFVIDSYGRAIEINTDEKSFNLYRLFKDEVDRKQIDEYSYIEYEEASLNNKGGIDMFFSTQGASEYKRRMHEKTTYQWDEKIVEKYGIQKEAIGEKGVAALARTKFKLPRAEKETSQQPPTLEETEHIKATSVKLKQLNEAVNKLESQYAKGLITKTEYRKYLKTLYKL